MTVVVPGDISTSCLDISLIMTILEYFFLRMGKAKTERFYYEETEVSIISLRDKGWSTYKIAKKVNLSQHGVSSFIQKWVSTRSLDQAPRAGCPPKLTEKEKRRIVRSFQSQ